MHSRRSFLRDAATGVAVLIAAGCSPTKRKTRAGIPGSSTTRPRSDAGFGGSIDAGSIDDIRSEIERTRVPHYVPEARAYVSPFPTDLVDRARKVYPVEALPALSAGIVVLYQRCTHLGCRVPWCASSQWFECPCHAARFDRVGESRAGPAPRGMDMFKAAIVHGRLVVDTAAILHGVPIGTNTTHQAPAGPSCV